MNVRVLLGLVFGHITNTYLPWRGRYPAGSFNTGGHASLVSKEGAFTKKTLKHLRYIIIIIIIHEVIVP